MRHYHASSRTPGSAVCCQQLHDWAAEQRGSGARINSVREHIDRWQRLQQCGGGAARCRLVAAETAVVSQRRRHEACMHAGFCHRKPACMHHSAKASSHANGRLCTHAFQDMQSVIT